MNANVASLKLKIKENNCPKKNFKQTSNYTIFSHSGNRGVIHVFISAYFLLLSVTSKFKHNIPKLMTYF